MYLRIIISIISLDVFKVGDLVVLSSSESAVRNSFDSIDYDWVDEMIHMLGNAYFVQEVLEKGAVIAISSPDGSVDGNLHFSSNVFTLLSSGKYYYLSSNGMSVICFGYTSINEHCCVSCLLQMIHLNILRECGLVN